VLGGLDLRTAAVWADCAKGVSADRSERDFRYSSDDDRHPECAVFGTRERSARLVDYARANWTQCGAAGERCHAHYHYADICVFRDAYADTEVGARKEDVVHAIAAAVDVLEGRAPPAPFVIAGQAEAVMLLAHLVGDIHQPLHVAAIYLDAQGRAVDPDAAGYRRSTDTAGGNLVGFGDGSFHHEWDSIPHDFAPDGASYAQLREAARAVAPSAGDPARWSAQWAGDTLAAGKAAFQGVSFAPAPGFRADSPRWVATVVDGRYAVREREIKRRQLAKAGARLAQLLRAIWPDRGR